MNIEVTKKTFNKIFQFEDCTLRQYSKQFAQWRYYNKELDQFGFAIENFTSQVKQYYLTDINA